MWLVAWKWFRVKFTRLYHILEVFIRCYLFLLVDLNKILVKVELNAFSVTIILRTSHSHKSRATSLHVTVVLRQLLILSSKA